MIFSPGHGRWLRRDHPKRVGPNLVIEKHTHPFDARVQVATGQVRLELVTGAQTFEAGQGFFIPRGTEHSEQYGPNGATFWVARKS